MQHSTYKEELCSGDIYNESAFRRGRLYNDRMHAFLFDISDPSTTGVALPVETPGTSAEDLRELSGVPPPEKKGKGFSIWTLATGIVYGLQPDALFVVIPAVALPTKLAAATYMAMFVAGTVLAMGSYTAFIGKCWSSRTLLTERMTNTHSSKEVERTPSLNPLTPRGFKRGIFNNESILPPPSL